MKVNICFMQNTGYSWSIAPKLNSIDKSQVVIFPEDGGSKVSRNAGVLTHQHTAS
jgi:hypothetical protein